jgi:hypothetical protein
MKGRKGGKPPRPLIYVVQIFGGLNTSAPELIRSIQAVYLKRDGAVSVVHRVADLDSIGISICWSMISVYY